ncbi:MAG TPA: IS1634 family transposase [Thermoanaerobaculia bacterium]|nr:IS1634 family transposase [Thermoanaerobaculia bacterium]
MLVARTLWTQLGLDTILDRLDGRASRDAVPLADRCLALVANRLCTPSSEHGLARWLETDYVCDRQGRRWVPRWRNDEQRLASLSPRVRVEARQLQQWYRTLDQLHARKRQIEQELYLRLRDLFSLQVDLVLYDLTSTFFEGLGPPQLGAHGHSRDGKPRNRQVLVGMVMVDGWPLAQHVFAGNRRDATTVPAILDDLQQRFGLRRVVFVGDRGMVTSENLELLRSLEQGYVVGLNRRRSATIYRYLQRATGHWLECPVGITASEKARPPRTRVQEVPSDRPGVRVFVVESEERLAYEQAERLKSMERTRQDLEALQRRVAQGKIRAADKVGAAAARLLGRNHGQRYYAWEYRDGVFDYREHPVNLAREKACEGKYLIQTEEPRLSALEAVQIYKSLYEVEQAFRHLKDIIAMRPIYHQTDTRVEAHLFVASLAFLLQRLLERRLQDAGLDLSAAEALQALHTVCVVDLDLGNDQTKRSVTRGSARAAAILRAVGITDLQPPGDPSEREVELVL